MQPGVQIIRRSSSHRTANIAQAGGLSIFGIILRKRMRPGRMGSPAS
jgi:uncharacterized cupin superfamily protein